jgi:Mn2+/Fe2+ NRAMP family transporter
MSPSSRPRLLAVIGPGLLVAATGVGAGDLATAGFAGSRLGTAVLWAVVLGALLKFVVTEGLTRWQLATGQTVLAGAVTRMGPVVSVLFLAYLLPWSFFVGAALISACGATAATILEPTGLFESPAQAKLALGVAHSAVGVTLVWLGGFKVFERVMAACVGVMFVGVVVTGALVRPDVGEIARGLAVPAIPQAAGDGLVWTIALMGGVGGTLTVICYGYWIREERRTGPEHLGLCRLDLAVGYAVTALFGLAMVVIARGMTIEGSGAALFASFADQLEAALGPAARWIFLAGAWAAVFSSLLGVWQAVPYVFAEFVGLHVPSSRGRKVSTRSWTYRGYLLALAIVPIVQVQHPFRDVQKWYAVMGAAFIPMLAIVLLVLNRRRWTGELRNRPVTVGVLVVTVALFALACAAKLIPLITPGS